ncbi:TIGR01244 family sulfur transferase [Sphingomonas sp. LY160]|uniref:TIGR01244 family sulfur transferase n=1 Tax=Sphingomonas sp. LY160 TaxID=3095342 RepID=UPI002ADEAF0D|nr:TIGR01244 family sulfur transferase [Sphingomonas sp. LY160]MEA1071804.1 TIGR01244 family sulfur transferase [Sphingomonas sp. LY160]
MKIAILTPNVSVLPQPEVADIAELADRGYRSIISNRPEGETEGQPEWNAIKAAATARGMEAVHIPVVAGAITDADVTAFSKALDRLPWPIAAFCRTGTRSALLWALANQASLTVDERIEIAAKEGYDLEPFRARLSLPSDQIS